VPPTPPSASGTDMPSTPSSAPSRAHTFGSKRGSDSISRRTVCSSKCSVQNLRTAARSCCCSSVNVNVGERPAALSGCSASSSATRDLLPRHAGVGAQITGQSEDPLAQDVAHHLGRAALDGVGAAAQIALLDRAAPVVAGAAVHVVAVVQHALGPEQIHAELVDLLIEFRADQLADRRLRAGSADGGGGTGPFGGEPLSFCA